MNVMPFNNNIFYLTTWEITLQKNTNKNTLIYKKAHTKTTTTLHWLKKHQGFKKTVTWGRKLMAKESI